MNNKDDFAIVIMTKNERERIEDAAIAAKASLTSFILKTTLESIKQEEVIAK